jgi:hypothetical protein
VNKIDYQIQTVAKMIQLYCRLKHNCIENLCFDCTELLNYSIKRLQNCPYGENKPECKDCKTHCYNKINREKIREVIRFAGPRMIFYSPFDFIKHITAKYLRK